MSNDLSALAAVLKSAGPSDRGLATDPLFYDLLTGSYVRLVGTPLVADRPDGPRWLYEDAPFCLLAHNTDADPRFIYANRAAQACFEYSWEEMTSLSSRLSAEAPNREERQRLLDSVLAQGFASDYRGLRIAKSGRRFWIEDATVWQLLGPDGKHNGQAAVLRSWRDA
jgi:PAS domain S-box-containing protein